MPKLTCFFSLATLCTFATFALPLAAQDAPRINEIIVVGVQDSHTVATDDTLVAPAEIFMGASCGIFNMTDMTPRNYPKKKSDLYKVEY